jgi:hypothetical protein
LLETNLIGFVSMLILHAVERTNRKRRDNGEDCEDDE